MEYDSSAQFANSAILGGPAQNRPADLPSLRSHLEQQVERARSIFHRVESAADTVFGSQPTSIENAKPPEPISVSFAELVDNLSRILGRIENSLNRL
jgi:hypothetical protein